MKHGLLNKLRTKEAEAKICCYTTIPEHNTLSNFYEGILFSFHDCVLNAFVFIVDIQQIRLLKNIITLN